jgi:hypothetical protein
MPVLTFLSALAPAGHFVRALELLGHHKGSAEGLVTAAAAHRTNHQFKLLPRFLCVKRREC